MNKISSFAALVTVTLIGIAAESAWSDEATPNGSAKPAVQTPASTTGVTPGWYPPPIRGGYTRPWQQLSQRPVPPRGFGQRPPSYPPPGQYRAVPTVPAAAVNPLNAELKQTQEQLTAKSTELDTAHAMLEQLRGTLQRSVAAERSLRKNVADITSEQQALQARVTELTAALNTTTAALEQHRQQSTNNQEQNRTLTAEHDRLRNDLASRDERLATVHAELQSAREALQQAQAETGTTSQQLSEARSQAETVNNELTELKTQLESQKTTLLNAEQTRTEERDRLHRDLASRNEQLATAHAELQTTKEALQQAQTETFNNELTELKAQLESQKTTWLNAEQTRMLTAERDRLHSDLASQDERLATVHTELDAATQALQLTQTETSTTTQQLSKARAQTETLNNELTELKAQLEGQKITRLNTEQTRTEERDKLRNDLASQDEQLATVHAELQVATQALQQTQAEASTSAQQLSAARAQAEAANNELTELKTQLENQKTTLLSVEQARTLTAERDRLHNDLASRDEQLATVHAELDAATQALQQTQADTSISAQQLSAARSQAEAANNELTELKTQLENQKTTLLSVEQARTLTAERDRLHNDLASRDERLATVHAELDAATQALQQTQAETSTAAQQRSEAARAQTEMFNNELAELKTQLESQKTMLLDAEQTLGTEINERDGLQENLAACSQELTQAQAALTDARSVEDALLQAPPPAAGVTAPQTATTDTDADGVSDNIDLCPGTQHGTAVESTGCATGVAINLEGVNFLYNSHELTDKARGILDRVADVIVQRPELRLEVAGHTDATGDPAYNQELSMQRAEAVRDYLVAQGANPRYIGAAGYGGQRPIAENTTFEGLQKNRRVELRVLH